MESQNYNELCGGIYNCGIYFHMLEADKSLKHHVCLRELAHNDMSSDWIIRQRVLSRPIFLVHSYINCKPFNNIHMENNILEV